MLAEGVLSRGGRAGPDDAEKGRLGRGGAGKGGSQPVWAHSVQGAMAGDNPRATNLFAPSHAPLICMWSVGSEWSPDSGDGASQARFGEIWPGRRFAGGVCSRLTWWSVRPGRRVGSGRGLGLGLGPGLGTAHLSLQKGRWKPENPFAEHCYLFPSRLNSS